MKLLLITIISFLCVSTAPVKGKAVAQKKTTSKKVISQSPSEFANKYMF